MVGCKRKRNPGQIDLNLSELTWTSLKEAKKTDCSLGQSWNRFKSKRSTLGVPQYVGSTPLLPLCSTHTDDRHQYINKITLKYLIWPLWCVWLPIWKMYVFTNLRLGKHPWVSFALNFSQRCLAPVVWNNSLQLSFPLPPPENWLCYSVVIVTGVSCSSTASRCFKSEQHFSYEMLTTEEQWEKLRSNLKGILVVITSLGCTLVIT